MDIRQLTDSYFVAPQLDPSDMAAVAQAGIKTIICNRPDAEVPPSHQAQAMREAAEAAGLEFVEIPLTHQTFTPDNIAKQRDVIAHSSGAVLAYCASGTRSSMAWAMGQAGQMPVDAILNTAQQAGYDLRNIQPTLAAIASQAQG